MTEPDDRLDLLAPTQDGLSPALQDVLTADIIAALRTVHDPEIPVNIYDLGLIYRIEPKAAGLVEIDMTLTAPGCPVAGEMVAGTAAPSRRLDCRGNQAFRKAAVCRAQWAQQKVMPSCSMP